MKVVRDIPNKLLPFLARLAEEPPFRIFGRTVVKRFAKSVRTKSKWDAVSRPHYLIGILTAADQAIREGVPAISVIEFGVAGGNGLVALDRYAAAVERETAVRIAVYGFDTGEGIPQTSGDYKDHPDQWKPGDYAMDEYALRERLSDRATLVIGNVRQTVPKFVSSAQYPPVGFIAVDVDLYSSAVDALQIFVLPGNRMLRRVPIYFDDIDFFFNHKFAGELLAIEEFNAAHPHIKIDRWRGIRKGKVFTESPWLDKMFVAHDLDAISKIALARAPARDLRLAVLK
jgi:hypothetical protein